MLDHSELLTKQEAARRLSISVRSLERELSNSDTVLDKRQITTRRVGITAESVEAYIAGLRRLNTAKRRASLKPQTT